MKRVEISPDVFEDFDNTSPTQIRAAISLEELNLAAHVGEVTAESEAKVQALRARLAELRVSA